MQQQTNEQATVVDAIADLVQVPAQAVTSQSVLVADGVRVVAFALDTGQSLAEHSAGVPVLLQVVSGSVDVEVEGATHALRPGGLAHIPARTRHSVTAVEPTIICLTLIGRPSPPPAD